MSKKDEFLSYELSIIFKELGFNFDCFGMYFPNGNLEIGIDWDIVNLKNPEKIYCSAPTWNQARMFLMVKYRIFIEPEMWLGNKNNPMFTANGYYIFDGEREYIDESEICDYYINYNVAVEKTILKAIDLIKNKNINYALKNKD